MKLLLVALLGLASSPALAQNCEFHAYRGPALKISEDRTTAVVDMGDWVEECTLEWDTRGNTHIPGLSGWKVPTIIVCKAFSGQFSYVEGVEPRAAVFNGVTFIEKCGVNEIGAPGSTPED